MGRSVKMKRASGSQNQSPAKLVKTDQTTNQFGLSWFQSICKEKGNENVFVSGYSVSLALSMVLLGASGNSLDELQQILHCFENKSNLSNKPNQRHFTLPILSGEKTFTN